MADRINNWQQFINEATFNLDYGSVNYNLFDLLMSHGLGIYSNISKTDEWVSIDNAVGVALDNIGANYGAVS